MKASVLFFDDFPFAAENVLFLHRLRAILGPLNAGVLLEKSLGQLEERLKSGRYAALILDIMFQVPGGFRSIEDGRAVSSSAGGMEILRRCRNGYYGSVNKEIPIFIRSARGEAHIAALCKKLGANGYFQVGIHDSELIDALTGGLTGAS